ncbi:MAG TPA: EAL domain-containing protein [Xanthobacteraceae bacterium]|nr:EAL domain-containing protein [Xanthobacteraceae bacterium]
MTQPSGTSQQPFLRWLYAIAQSSTLLGLGMIGLIWMSLAFHVSIERDNAEQAAIENSKNLARAFDAHLSQSLADISRTLGVMRAYYLRDPDHFDLRLWNDGGRFGREMIQISIVGADGHVRGSSAAQWEPVYVGDREHFRALAATRDDILYISKPVIGRISHRPTIQLSRRIERADGSFGGIITASLDPSYFARLYDSVAVGADGYIHVIGTDGIIRAAGGSVQEEPGRDITTSRMFTLLKTQPDGWFYSDSPHVDGIRRLVVYRTIKDFPLIVSIGRSTQEIFASVTAKQRSYNTIAAILTALILAAIGQSVHGALRLGRASEEQRLQNARFHAALNNMPHGVSMYDRDGGLLVSNSRYLDMYGMPPELAAIGTPVEKLIAHRLAREGTVGDPAERARDLLASIAAGKPVVVQSRLGDGRTINITQLPIPGGGFVATHEDITGRQQAERELRSTKNFLDTIIENIPMPLVVKDPQTQKFTFVNQAYEEFIGRPRENIIGKTVYDLYPVEHAQPIVDQDNAASAAARTGSTNLIKAELPALTPRGERIINTLRLAVGGEDETPGHLITVFEDVTDRRKAEEQVVHMALHDALTDLPNRTRFQARLREALARVERGDKLAVHCLDLDNFKNINDALGHAVGDELLKSVAARLRGCVRDVDAIARLGGDEFAIIQCPIEDAADAARLAQRIRDEIGKPFDLGGVQAVCNASIGIAVAPTDATEPEALLKQADMALYGAKAEGRGVYRFFQPEMDARMRLRHAIEQDLRDAIAVGGFRLYYQPVVDVASGEVTGVEALLRWPHPERGMVPPSEFISVAEESALIIPLGEWVLRRALTDAACWPEHIRIAVNLSPVQFRSRTLAQTVIAACAAARVSPTRLELEVTEAAFLAATKDVLATLDQLRHLGVKIVMDDFGTGYSSLNYLRRFRFDKIKIDRSFVRDLADRGSLSAVIIEAVVRLARALDVTTTAEGVETVEQLDIIRAAGVTQMQGFLYSPARPLEDIDALFAVDTRKVSAA